MPRCRKAVAPIRRSKSPGTFSLARNPKDLERLFWILWSKENSLLALAKDTPEPRGVQPLNRERCWKCRRWEGFIIAMSSRRLRHPNLLSQHSAAVQ
jgi:hypothetical protein